MAHIHTPEHKKKLMNRVSRVMGQVASVQRALEQEVDCSELLHTISACRGAMDALMAEVIEHQIRFHILANGIVSSEQTHAAEDLVKALRAYLK